MKEVRWTAVKIVLLRKRYGETQERFAERLAVCRETLSHWERGLNYPGGPEMLLLDQLEKACKKPESLPPLAEQVTA